MEQPKEPITSLHPASISASIYQRNQPVSKHGDVMHEMCVPILDYFIEFGNEELNTKALKTRAYWEQNQTWVIDWAQRSRYFVLAEHACRDLRGFKAVIAQKPYQNEQASMILQIALECGERYNRPKGISRKKIAGKWKKKRK